jgi:hypothetical protein
MQILSEWHLVFSLNHIETMFHGVGYNLLLSCFILTDTRVNVFFLAFLAKRHTRCRLENTNKIEL